MSKLSGKGMKLQAKVQSMLEEYVDGPPVSRAEFTRQINIAKEVMREYEPALQELAC